MVISSFIVIFLVNKEYNIKEALKLLHGVQFSYIEGTNNNRGGNVQPTFHVESDFGVCFIIKSREIGFFQCEIGP